MSARGTIRVLVADDSETLRASVRHLLAGAEGIEIVGEAEDGVEAVDLAIALRPDVITMDVAMPRLDGLAATSAIMTEAPTRILIVCDARQEHATDLSFRAIAAGALEVVPKPAGSGGDFQAWGRRLIEAIRVMSAVPVISRRPKGGGAGRAGRSAAAVDVVGIVASTGGPPVLAALLGALGPPFGAAVLVAQHMAPGFTAGLVRWLSEASALPVAIASEGDPCSPGRVYLPADGHHLEVGPSGVLRIPRSDDEFHPSGDRLLASLAAVHGPRAAGVVLTGMGDDGARGLLAIRHAGGTTMAQEPSTCVVSGMPVSAAALGATRTLLAVASIAEALRRLAGG